MKKYNGYLIDLDGTMYLGNERIEAATEFVDALHEQNIPYLFLTNNSSKTQAQVSDKLNKMEIKSTPEHVFTSSMATAKYIKQQKKAARCYVIGEEGLYDALENEGLIVAKEECDFVIVGIDREVNYEKLAGACLAIRNGAEFISTNGDVAIPTERGLLPGNGAITSVITVSTGSEPTFIGKPETVIMNEAMNTLGMDKKNILMVGDNYNTDILAGVHAGIDTLMVFTGVTPFKNYPNLDKKPTYYVHSLQEWICNI
ncbi:TIGR01457 family HAD-type hydrolase [Virgibacillus ndiopensis]|uniref:TIGR01457 family HAD-type hydrolase n=1 Tax=Virgibacillus ndiopensis TaxID=2004408 RepID=UPI000C06D87D|nr:TIGR01457 family HAD-type hydrolase [Virgibacillus ndiopensis]